VDFADRVTHHPPARAVPRVLGSLWRQGRRSPVCPANPIEGQLGLVTGGSRGIGLETSRGLAARGAEVVVAARGAGAGEREAAALGAAHGRPAHFLPLDLADLGALPASLDRLERVLAGRALDVVVANAGLWPTRPARSAQGHELAFATNVLGHAALVRGALARGLLAPGCRVVVVTGDLYVVARECTAEFAPRGLLGGARAYCRSKLGNLWYARELARRRPELRVHAVHPGVVASELGGGNGALSRAVKRRILISPERGAQASLFCATQAGLASGTYYHNVLGRVELAPDDPACDDRRAGELWERLEGLAAAV